MKRPAHRRGFSGSGPPARQAPACARLNLHPVCGGVAGTEIHAVWYASRGIWSGLRVEFLCSKALLPTVYSSHGALFGLYRCRNASQFSRHTRFLQAHRIPVLVVGLWGLSTSSQKRPGTPSVIMRRGMMPIPALAALATHGLQRAVDTA